MLTFLIEGRSHDRAAVHAWEDRRMAAVRRKLRLGPSQAPREAQRAELTARKLDLEHDGLRQIVGRSLWWSEKIARISV